MSSVNIMLGIFVAVMAVAMAYFFGTVMKMENKGIVKRTIVEEEEESEEETPKVVARKASIYFAGVKGVGPKFSEKLQNAGIKNVKKLAASKPKQVAEALGISEERASSLIENARSLLED